MNGIIKSCSMGGDLTPPRTCSTMGGGLTPPKRCLAWPIFKPGSRKAPILTLDGQGSGDSGGDETDDEGGGARLERCSRGRG